MSHLRTIAESIAGAGTPIGREWLRRAVEQSGVDVSAVSGPWAKKLYVALGGDLGAPLPEGPWLRKCAYQLGAESLDGSWYAKVASDLS